MALVQCTLGDLHAGIKPEFLNETDRACTARCSVKYLLCFNHFSVTKSVAAPIFGNFRAARRAGPISFHFKTPA